MNVDAFLRDAAAWVNAALDRTLPPADAEPRRLHEAMRHAVFAGGKRLRPAVTLAACRAVGGSDDEAVASACALEMLHTYSLIHDDLPAIDDDDLRRGRPTCHVAFGEATAILAGDALQTEAFRVLAEETPRRDAIPALVAELARAAGTGGMVGGEIADIEAEGGTPDLERTLSIHDRKTAALFRASAVMGGIAAGAGDAACEALAAYGRDLGLAFQIVDDVLDETGDSATLGKSAGKDRAARKMTVPAVLSLDECRRLARYHADQARAALGDLASSDVLAALVDLAVERSS